MELKRKVGDGGRERERERERNQPFIENNNNNNKEKQRMHILGTRLSSYQMQGIQCMDNALAIGELAHNGSNSIGHQKCMPDSMT